MRRTASISLLATEVENDLINIDNLLSINKKIELLIGFLNTTDSYKDYPILWFPQGVYVITNPSLSRQQNQVTISLNLHDKMALLNGECGGTFPAAISFHELEEEDAYGNITIKKPTILQIIRQLVNHWGGEQQRKIIINDIQEYIPEVLRWEGPDKKPLYIYNNQYLTLKKRQAMEQAFITAYNKHIEGSSFSDSYNAAAFLKSLKESLLLKETTLKGEDLEKLKTLIQQIEYTLTNLEDFFESEKQQKQTLEKLKNILQENDKITPKDFHLSYVRSLQNVLDRYYWYWMYNLQENEKYKNKFNWVNANYPMTKNLLTNIYNRVRTLQSKIGTINNKTGRKVTVKYKDFLGTEHTEENRLLRSNYALSLLFADSENKGTYWGNGGRSTIVKDNFTYFWNHFDNKAYKISGGNNVWLKILFYEIKDMRESNQELRYNILEEFREISNLLSGLPQGYQIYQDFVKKIFNYIFEGLTDFEKASKGTISDEDGYYLVRNICKQYDWICSYIIEKIIEPIQEDYNAYIEKLKEIRTNSFNFTEYIYNYPYNSGSVILQLDNNFINELKEKKEALFNNAKRLPKIILEEENNSEIKTLKQKVLDILEKIFSSEDGLDNYVSKINNINFTSINARNIKSLFRNYLIEPSENADINNLKNFLQEHYLPPEQEEKYKKLKLLINDISTTIKTKEKLQNTVLRVFNQELNSDDSKQYLELEKNILDTLKLNTKIELDYFDENIIEEQKQKYQELYNHCFEITNSLQDLLKYLNNNALIQSLKGIGKLSDETLNSILTNSIKENYMDLVLTDNNKTQLKSLSDIKTEIENKKQLLKKLEEKLDQTIIDWFERIINRQDNSIKDSFITIFCQINTFLDNSYNRQPISQNAFFSNGTWESFQAAFIAENNKIKLYKYGEDIGYTLTQFSYPGQLIAQPGETVVSVLEKIKNTLGNFEFFYDIDGNFIFREIRNYLNTSLSTFILKDKIAHNYTSSKIVYDFSNSELIQSYQNNPNYQGIKNDFVVWGEKSLVDGQKSPIRYHFAIDSKPAIRSIYFWELSNYLHNISIQTYNYKEDFPKEGNRRTKYLAEYENRFYEWVEEENGNLYNGYRQLKDRINNNPNCLRFPTKKNFPAKGDSKYLYYDESTDSLYDYTIGLQYQFEESYKIKKCKIVKNKRMLPTSNKDGLYYYCQEENLIVRSRSGTYQDTTYIPIRVNDYRTELFLDGYTKEVNGLTSNYYYTELKSEWPKIFSLYNGNFHKQVQQNKYEINYFLDLLSTSQLNAKYGISKIGRRTLTIKNNTINCIFEPNCPDNIYLNINPILDIHKTIEDATKERDLKLEENEKIKKLCKEYNKKNLSNFTIKEIDDSIYKYFALGGRLRSAYEEIRSLIHQYLTYNQAVSISMIPCYYLEPNVRIALNDSKTGIFGEYVIQSIQLSLNPNESMNITCGRALERI